MYETETDDRTQLPDQIGFIGSDGTVGRANMDDLFPRVAACGEEAEPAATCPPPPPETSAKPCPQPPEPTATPCPPPPEMPIGRPPPEATTCPPPSPPRPCVCVCAPLVCPEAAPDQQQRPSSDRPREEGEADAQKFGQQARGSQTGRPPKRKAPIAERLATTVMDAVETIETLSFVVATLSASSLAVFAVWVFRKGRRNGYCGGRDKGLPKRDGWTDRKGGIELNNLAQDETSPNARQRRRRHNPELDEIVVGRRQRVPEPDDDPFDRTMRERAERRQQHQQAPTVGQPGGARGGHEDSILPAKAEPRD